MNFWTWAPRNVAGLHKIVEAQSTKSFKTQELEMEGHHFGQQNSTTCFTLNWHANLFLCSIISPSFHFQKHTTPLKSGIQTLTHTQKMIFWRFYKINNSGPTCINVYRESLNILSWLSCSSVYTYMYSPYDIRFDLKIENLKWVML